MTFYDAVLSAAVLKSDLMNCHRVSFCTSQGNVC